MNSEESRLRTFANWPENAVVDARRIAKAGFYYMGQGEEVQCFSCGARISEWNIGDSVMGRHRALDSHCPFVRNPAMSGNIPLLTHSRSPNNSLERRSIFHDEQARLETFASWPIRTIVSPELLVKSGFYYTQIGDKVRCVYCNGAVERWETGDEPDREHLRHFPDCSFIRSKRSAEASLSLHSTGVDLRQSSTPDNSTPQNGSSDTLKELGVQDHRIPRYPKFATFESRLSTFSQWPPSLNQKPHELAEAGFYFTGCGDQVRCFHCDGGLRLWERDDEPWTEHARWFPYCGFILLVKGQEFVDEANTIGARLAKSSQLMSPKTRSASPLRRVNSVTEQQLQELMNSPNALAALQMGIDSSRIKQALRHRMEYLGVPFSTPDALVVAALELQTEQIAVAECDDWGTPPDSPTVERWRGRREEEEEGGGGAGEPPDVGEGGVLPPPPPAANPSSSNSRRGSPQPSPGPAPSPAPASSPAAGLAPASPTPPQISLEEENRRLREARLCKICMDSEVMVVFLPCRHLVTCPHCAPSLSDCPLCRQPIKATVRTFLS